MILRPLIGFKVTIKRDGSAKYALRKALVVTRTSTILDSVVEVDIGKSTDPHRERSMSYKVPYLLTPALYILVNAIPIMQQLHTVQLNNIILSRMCLHTILSTPYPIHLILDTVQLPKIISFHSTTLRKLTLSMMSSWETVRPLIAQLATSLEYLELKWCEFLPPSQLQLPSFPCLQEIRYRQHSTRRNFPDESELNELLRLAPQVTRLHVTGHILNEPITACRESLQYLLISIWMLSEHMFGTKPFPRLMHLSLIHYEFADIFPPSSFISDHFPMIKSLDLSILWEFRNHAMVTARSHHRVQTLKLVIMIRDGINDDEVDPCFPVGAPNDQLHCAMLPAALQTLKLEVTEFNGELERSAIRCNRWIFDDVIPSVTGLGGPGLKSIGLLVSVYKGRPVAREQALSRQWVKAPNGDWHRVE